MSLEMSFSEFNVSNMRFVVVVVASPDLFKSLLYYECDWHVQRAKSNKIEKKSVGRKEKMIKNLVQTFTNMSIDFAD